MAFSLSSRLSNLWGLSKAVKRYEGNLILRMTGYSRVGGCTI